MPDYTRLAPGEAYDRAVVTVTFLRINHRHARPAPAAPAQAKVAVEKLGVPAYRALYDAVGGPWLWWLRRVMPDEQLARCLASRTLAVHVLRVGGAVAGFYETDSSTWPDINLNYFGLLPEMIGRGLGGFLLAHAIDGAFTAPGVRGMTVNTCTADHRRALPNYLAAGFVETRQVREVWDIPRRLGLVVPPRLRG